MSSVARSLAEYAGSYSAGGFDWRRANCGHFAAGWVKLRTGRDPMEDLPETATAMEARRLVRALGGIRQAVTKQTGCVQVLATLAQVGDLVLRELPDGGYSVGICAGRNSMHVDSDGAVVHLGMAGAVCAWRVEGVAQ